MAARRRLWMLAVFPGTSSAAPTRDAVLRCSLLMHAALSLRWCVWAVVVYLAFGSALLAAELGGQFCGWSLCVLLADLAVWDYCRRCLHKGSRVSRLQVGLWLLVLSLALVIVVQAPLGFGVPVGGAMGLLMLAPLLCACRKDVRRAPTWLYRVWCIGEALLGILVSHFLFYIFKFLIIDDRWELEGYLAWFWVIVCTHCALSYVSAMSSVIVVWTLGSHLRSGTASAEDARELFLSPTPHGVELGAAACEAESGAAPPRALHGAGAEAATGAGDADRSPARRHGRRCSPLSLTKAVLGAMVLAYAVLVASCAAVFVWLSEQRPGELFTVAAGKASCNGCFCHPRCLEEDLVLDIDVPFDKVFDTRHGNYQTLRLDIKRCPQSAGVPHVPSPVVMFIHGGAFHHGGKQQTFLYDEATALAVNGFTTFSIDYRKEAVTLPTTGAVMDAVTDAKAAVRFIVRNAASYGVDPHRIGVWGESAGAIVAATMNYVGAPDAVTPPSNVSAAVGVSGFPWPFLVAGLDKQKHPRKQQVPWLDIHGDMDIIVPQFLASAAMHWLHAWGAPAEKNRLLIVPGGAHIPWNAAIAMRPSPKSVLRPLVVDYFTRMMSLDEKCRAPFSARDANTVV